MKTKKKKQKKSFNKLYVLLAVVLLLIAAIFILRQSDKDVPAGNIQESEQQSWQTYVNDEYNFSIDFPRGWHLYEDFDTASPIINFYVSRPGVEAPLDHFSRTAHVSIYPNGIPTDGIIGDRVEISESQDLISENVSNFTNYTLNDGRVWARMITFEDHPESWKDWGFVWARTEVKNYQERCFSGEQEVSEFECNVFMGDEIRRFGEVNEDMTQTQLKMLNSFKFLE
jgi:hypothetical protein